MIRIHTFKTLIQISEKKEIKVEKLVGEFNDWNVEKAVKMKKTKGIFKATVELETGKEYQFRYIADQENWFNDNEADKYVATPFGVENSVVSALN